MGKWSDLYEKLTSKHEYIKPNPPALHADIYTAEEKIGCKLPKDLADLLLEMNGDSWFIFSIEQIIEANLSVRQMDFYMPLDCILFFSGNGCGDYFGYPITREDGVRSDRVFLWEHESDDRSWKTVSLEETIEKYYNDDI